MQALWATVHAMVGLLKEPRIVVGIGLMILATLIGGLYMQRATARIPVWQVDHALAAGTVLTSGDVHLAEVAGDLSAYASADEPVLGRMLDRPVRAGELLPNGAFTKSTSPTDDVMVPATVLHMPDALTHGELVDVWVTSDDPAHTERVLRAVRVLRTISADVGGGRGVALAVPPALTQSLIAAMHRGELDLVRVDA